MTDTSGLRFCEPFAHYDPEQSCWRTSEATFPWGSDEFSETWPKRGSMRNGVCYERRMSAPPMAGPECSSLLATPMAHDRTFSPRKVAHGIQLANQVAALLPTPTANQPGGTAEQMLERKSRMPGGARTTVTDLRMVVELLPTPTARKAGPDYRQRTEGDDLYQAASRIGATTNPPSDAGNEPSDGQLPPL